MKLIKSCDEKSVCKICKNSASLYGVVDFNKNCQELNSLFVPLSGIPIYYHQCSSCDFLFTNAFDKWDTEQYLRYIYNDDYTLYDPNYDSIRPSRNAEMIVNILGEERTYSILDFGSGNGKLAALLREKGHNSYCWDPLTKGSQIASFKIV